MNNQNSTNTGCHIRVAPAQPPRFIVRFHEWPLVFRETGARTVYELAISAPPTEFGSVQEASDMMVRCGVLAAGSEIGLLCPPARNV